MWSPFKCSVKTLKTKISIRSKCCNNKKIIIIVHDDTKIEDVQKLIFEILEREKNITK
jgi:hypothetical protein